MELQIRTIQARDLEEVDRIIRLAFGTWLGVPDPMAVFGDRDFAHTDTALPLAAHSLRGRADAWSDRISSHTGAASDSSAP